MCFRTLNEIILSVIIIMEGYIEGMLDRDQRTAKLRLINNTTNHEHCKCLVNFHHQNNNNNNNNNNKSLLNCDKFSQYNSRRRSITSHNNFIHHHHLKHNNKHFWISVQKFQQVLIVGVYLTLVTTIPTKSTAAPTNYMNMMDERLAKLPKWYHPCGSQNSVQEQTGGGATDQLLNDFHILEPLCNTANIALGAADAKKDELALKIFGMPYENSKRLLNHLNYTWLPRLPKKQGEKVPDDHLSQLTLEKAMVDSYMYLQTIAAGLEQMRWDDVDNNNSLLSHIYNSTEDRIMTILCELQDGMLASNIKIGQNVQRDVVPINLRANHTSDAGERKTRDLLIFREYLNVVEYVKECFEYLRDKASNGQ